MPPKRFFIGKIMESEKPRLVLDLDGTLICEMYEDDVGNFESFNVNFKSLDGYESQATLAKRPGLQQFLDFCLANFVVGVWSMAQPDYVKSVVSSLKWTPNFVLDWTNCDRERAYVYKNLDNLPFSGKIIMIDDSPEVIRKTKENITFQQVKRWECQNEDNELTCLIETLKKYISDPL